MIDDERLDVFLRNGGDMRECMKDWVLQDGKSIPVSSSFFAFRLNCFHHDVKSRFDGGEGAS